MRAFAVETSVVSAAISAGGFAAANPGVGVIPAGDCGGGPTCALVSGAAGLAGGGSRCRLSGKRIGVRINTAAVSSRARTKRLFIVARSVGNRVVPAWMEGMTAKYSPHRERRASPRSVAVHCLDCVVRASRSVSTRRRQQRSEDDLVSAKEKDERKLSGCANHGRLESFGATWRTASSNAPNFAS
jgi:hypothetical protein